MSDCFCDDDDDDDVDDDDGYAGAAALGKRRCFSVDAVALRDDARLSRDWPTFWEDLETEGEVVMGMLGLAKHQVRLWVSARFVDLDS